MCLLMSRVRRDHACRGTCSFRAVLSRAWKCHRRRTPPRYASLFFHPKPYIPCIPSDTLPRAALHSHLAKLEHRFHTLHPSPMISSLHSVHILDQHQSAHKNSIDSTGPKSEQRPIYIYISIVYPGYLPHPPIVPLLHVHRSPVSTRPLLLHSPPLSLVPTHLPPHSPLLDPSLKSKHSNRSDKHANSKANASVVVPMMRISTYHILTGAGARADIEDVLTSRNDVAS